MGQLPSLKVSKRIFSNFYKVSRSILFYFLPSLFLIPSCFPGNSKEKETEFPGHKLHWVWEDDFSQADKEKLSEWIENVYVAAVAVLGEFPFDINIHFYIQQDAGEPVPWAHTRRSGIQSVHFHVDTSYAMDQFLADWTAPHEISHVALPFLGKENGWFAEGFATYMQCQVMQAMHVMTEQEVLDKYREKIAANKPFFENEEKPFAEAARQIVRVDHNYPAMYWGSVTFFINLDKRLRPEKGFGLNHLIQLYQKQGRSEDQSIEEMVKSLDDLVGKPICADLFRQYSEEPAKKVFADFSI